MDADPVAAPAAFFTVDSGACGVFAALLDLVFDGGDWTLETPGLFGPPPEGGAAGVGVDWPFFAICEASCLHPEECFYDLNQTAFND